MSLLTVPRLKSLLLFHTVSSVFLILVNAAIPPPSNEYWQVNPPLNYSDVLYAGWAQIPVSKEILVYNGTLVGRTYAHHPELYAQGENVWLIHSTAAIDEDSMGMDVWSSVSNDGGFTWSESKMILPPALLANQTDVANFSYWCNEAIWQRAIGGLAVIEINDEIWAVGETTNFYCWGTIGSGTKGAGRVARQVDADNIVLGDPCWITMNNYTNEVLLYNQTIYGTEYGMKFCDLAQEMEGLLNKPENVPAWSSWLYNDELYAEDGFHYMQENTHAVWIPGDGVDEGFWQRFWRDITATNNTQKVWVEYSFHNGTDWYPAVEREFGNNITKTNIPDAKTKQFLGTVGDGPDRFLISNPRRNSELIRQPLTIAMSYGKDLAYNSVGVLRTNSSDAIAPDTRGYKNQGFSYPSAFETGENLITAYSENKENIWVSVVSIADLPRT